MPALRRSLPISLLAIALVLPFGAADAAVAGTLHGTGTASTFTLYSMGTSIQGGAYQRTFACRDCLLQIAFTDVQVVLVQNGQETPLVPGSYEIRNFVGTFSYTWRAPHVLDVQLSGAGHASRL